MNRKKFISFLAVICLSVTSGAALAKKGGISPKGLNPQAMQELSEKGVDKYVGAFQPAASFPVGDGWVKHVFDPDNGDGPICIAGTPFSVFTKAQNTDKVLIMLQGGGACWEGFYNCNVFAESQEAPPPEPPQGIWNFDTKMNPLRNWSVVYMPYCDGSVFLGDNDVVDPNWQAFIEAALKLPPGTGPAVRFHRGLRNVTAGIDVAKAMFPDASRILVAGSSAGGVGATGLAPFLARMAYGNNRKLMVFNDAGPVAINLAETAAIAKRAADWQFGQFLPESCTTCSETGQSTELIKWRLANDSTIREAFYSTDFDATNRFFMNLLPVDDIGQALAYRNLIITEHGAIHDLFPDRYKRFIEAFRFSHTALQTPILYDPDRSVDGITLFEWLDDFLVPRPFWEDVVAELPPIP